MSLSERHIRLTEAISPTQKVHLEAESLTLHNQKVLIGGVYRLDWAQVSPLRHQPGPEHPGALAKWEGNTIKCQDQLNYKCIRTSSSVASLFAASASSEICCHPFCIMWKCHEFGTWVNIEEINSAAADSTLAIITINSPLCRRTRTWGRVIF